MNINININVNFANSNELEDNYFNFDYNVVQPIICEALEKCEAAAARGERQWVSDYYRISENDDEQEYFRRTINWSFSPFGYLVFFIHKKDSPFYKVGFIL